jgi:uncharacterized protein YndB with AHSA1/START domain
MATKKVTKKKATAKKVAPKKAAAKKAAPKKTKAAAVVAAPAKKLPVGKGPLGYTTSNVFPKHTIKQVWDAVTQAKHLKKHFVDDMRGEYGKDKRIVWYWKEWGEGWGATITKYAKHKEIEFQIADMSGKFLTTIRYEFVRKDGKTIFRIHESGYPAKDLKNAFMMCEGWTEFHCGVKAYLMGGLTINR